AVEVVGRLDLPVLRQSWPQAFEGQIRCFCGTPDRYRGRPFLRGFFVELGGDSR
ncbi:MAG: hypothetical protein ACI87E_003013, partial [Mariniblastus sp.]